MCDINTVCFMRSGSLIFIIICIGWFSLQGETSWVNYIRPEALLAKKSISYMRRSTKKFVIARECLVDNRVDESQGRSELPAAHI